MARSQAEYTITVRGHCTVLLTTFLLEMPFGKMPVLEVNGEMIAESQAMAAFAAEVAGMWQKRPGFVPVLTCTSLFFFVEA